MTTVGPTTCEYSIAILTPDSDKIAGDNLDCEFETASAIKSAIGSLVIAEAEQAGHSMRGYTVSLGPDHWSNGSSILKYPGVNLDQFLVKDDRKNTGTCVASLHSLLELNITASDCIATNGLIDYLGGQDAVNARLVSTFGLESMRLMTDRLYFPGVNHSTQPYQVGASTMADFVRYYAQIWPRSRKGDPAGRAHQYYQSYHGSLDANYLLNCGDAELPDDLEWLHKTGSVFDSQPKLFYGAMVDAGMLRRADKILYVAAGITSLHTVVPEGEDTTIFKMHFADLNIAALQPHGVELPLTRAA